MRSKPIEYILMFKTKLKEIFEEWEEVIDLRNETDWKEDTFPIERSRIKVDSVGGYTCIRY